MARRKDEKKRSPRKFSQEIEFRWGKYSAVSEREKKTVATPRKLSSGSALGQQLLTLDQRWLKSQFFLLKILARISLDVFEFPIFFCEFLCSLEDIYDSFWLQEFFCKDF